MNGRDGYMCVCVDIYKNTYIHMKICMYVCIYVCVYIYTLHQPPDRCKFGQGSDAKMIEHSTGTRGIYFLTHLCAKDGELCVWS